jgi:hypothetical protein
MKANTYSIEIFGITNPTFTSASGTGGTGMFSIETRRRTSTSLFFNLLDYNHAFGSVGINKAPTALANVAITATTSVVT